MQSLCKTEPALLYWICKNLTDKERMQLGKSTKDFFELLSPIFKATAREYDFRRKTILEVIRLTALIKIFSGECPNVLTDENLIKNIDFEFIEEMVEVFSNKENEVTRYYFRKLDTLNENIRKYTVEHRIAIYWKRFNLKQLTIYNPIFITDYQTARKQEFKESQKNDLIELFNVSTPNQALRHAAAKLNSIKNDDFKFLLSEADNINEPCPISGNTALHFALKVGNENFSHLLIANEAYVWAINKNDETPLHFAVLLDTDNLAEKLIARRADIGAMDKQGHTPLDKAIIEKKRACLPLLRKKTENQKNNLLKKFEVSTPEEAMRHATSKLNSITLSNFKLLLHHVDHIDKPSKNGNTALHWALKIENVNFAELLLEFNASCNRVNANKETPLHFAVLLDTDNLARKLISKGANRNAKDKEGRTPLEWAHKRNKTASLSLLRGT